jgi:hypothetical protein
MSKNRKDGLIETVRNEKMKNKKTVTGLVFKLL